MSNRPLILVTNDDGIAAPGLRVLTELAVTLGEVIVVAPDSPRSGQGHAITLETPLRLREVNVFDDLPVLAYECNGTPVDCVKLAKHHVAKGRRIDFCVSGINHGANYGINVLYSGTMSAAMEASLEGTPSIGFSLLDYSWEADFDHARRPVRDLLEHGLQQGLGQARLLNVNIPAASESGIAGVRICRQAEARWVEEFQQGKDPQGRPYFWLTGNFVLGEDMDGTDVEALEQGYISVVPTHHDLTLYPAMESLKKLEQLSAQPLNRS